MHSGHDNTIPPRVDIPRSISPLAGHLLLALLVLLMAYGVLLHGRTEEFSSPARIGALTDADLYQGVVRRMRDGQGYYDAANAQLRQMGFATRPFFNWRTPLLARFLALLPSIEWGRWILAVLACAAFLLWIGVLEQEVSSRRRRIAGGILLFFPLGMTVVTPYHNYHEAWSGVCIALSLALWAQRCPRASVTFGTLAVFLRELALPYLVVMMVAAAWQRRGKEALGWLTGIAAFALFLGTHAWIVSGYLTSADIVHEGWLQAGGWPFVVRTARCNPALLLAPAWVVGLILPLSLVGLATWRSPTGIRAGLTVGAYVAAFLIVGRSINTYWGLMYAPLLPLGLVFAPAALKDLLETAFSGYAAMRRRQSTSP